MWVSRTQEDRLVSEAKAGRLNGWERLCYVHESHLKASSFTDPAVGWDHGPLTWGLHVAASQQWL